MKKLYLLLPVWLLFVFSCKKAEEIKEEAQQNALVDLMVSGQWVVSSFTVNSSDITADFSGYKFQYFRNKTVNAIKNNVVEKTGTWDGDIVNRTTWANFPSVPNPLLLINGTWNIVDSGLTYVIASQTSGSDVKVMRLDKV